jgi:2',3'-cyclic-nucleotide 2'-phosphodiesterase (5'-nucleotidase family)
MRKFISGSILVIVFFNLSCHTFYKPGQVQYSSYRVQNAGASNSTFSNLLVPYSDSVNKLMHKVIGYNEILLGRKKQANILGYFIADAYLFMGKKRHGEQVVAAFMNSGGVRLPELAAGPITQGKIFELMPFDNQMMVVKMKGSFLKQYLDTLLVRDGIIQSGLTLRVVNKVSQDIMVGDKPLDPNTEYTIVHSDYVVNNTPFLKNVYRNTDGYLLRDAIIDYVRITHEQGKKIIVQNTERVSYAE